MQNDTSPHTQPVIACNLKAIPADQREHHEALALGIFAAVQEMQALLNGYAFRLPTTSVTVRQVAEYIANERLCCPFFNFALDIEPNEGPFWLRLTGGEGIKEFIKAEFPAILDPTIVEGAGLQ